MSLYESLSPSYDGLFPVDPRAGPFLDALAKPAREGRAPAVLDAGCATGSHALALATLGWNAVGIDSERAMIELARDRAHGMEGGRPTFLVADLLDIAALFDRASFELILCLGNTLPHLLAKAPAFLSQAASLLAPAGTLVLQTLNFSLPGIGPGYDFPDITDGRVSMRRSYRESPEGGTEALSFVVELVSPGESRRDETLLAPIGPSRLESMLEAAGLRVSARLSGWDGRPFSAAGDLFCITVAVA